MRQANSRMNIVRKGDKENKLKEFITRYLAQRDSEPPAAAEADQTVFVVARSSESPVAKVLAELMPELSARGITLKALYALPGEMPQAVSVHSSWAPPRIECRNAHDVRLLEAHETLVLGPRTAWVGDCMRREPGHGDAYEFYADDCFEMSAAALRSFNRLWAMAKPARPRVVSDNPNPVPLPQLAVAKSPVIDLVLPVSFSRH